MVESTVLSSGWSGILVMGVDDEQIGEEALSIKEG